MRDEPAQEREVGGDAADLRLPQRLRETVERLPARVAGGDQLRDQRVVRAADLVALAHAGIDADPLG